MGPLRRAPPGDHGGHGRDLDRRHLELALADGHGDRLSGIPGRLEGLHLPLRARHEAFLLADEVDAGLPAQAEAGGGLGDRVDAHPPAERVEIDVARVPDRVGQVHGPVPRREPAVAHGAVDLDRARAVDRRALGDVAEAEPAEAHDQLEDRARRVETADGPVLQRRKGIGHEIDPLGRREPGDELVGIVGRGAGQGQDPARLARRAPRRRLRGPRGPLRPRPGARGRWSGGRRVPGRGTASPAHRRAPGPGCRRPRRRARPRL